MRDTVQKAGNPPLFIVGCGRSGTTLVRLMLDSHPDIALPGESHFIPYLWKRRRRYLYGSGVRIEEMTRDILRSPHVIRWGLTEEHVRSRVHQLHEPEFPAVIAAFFEAYADQNGKPRWGDKTPSYVRYMPLLSSLFPEARFVHIIRDGRDVALSYLSLPWGPATIWEAARKWRRDVGSGRRSGAALGNTRYLEVRYEKLVADPVAVLKMICTFAGLEYTDRMLRYQATAMDRLQNRPDRARFHSSVEKLVSRGLRDWASQMPAKHVLAFESVAGDLLDELDYERRFPAPALHWRIRALVALWRVELRILGSRMLRSVRRWSNPGSVEA